MAARNILRQRRRSAIAIVAIAFGITALILATGFIERMFSDIRESTIKPHLGHLQIVRPGYHDAGKANPYAYLLPEVIPPELSASMEARTVKTIAPRLSFSGLISHDASTISFIGDAVSPQDEVAFGEGLEIASGKNLSADPRTVIIGEGLARNLGIKVGDRVVLMASTTSGGTNGVEVTVQGLFQTASKAYDDSALRLPLATARELLRTKGSHVWVVLLDKTTRTDTALAAIRKTLPADQFEVVPWYRLSDFYNKTTALFNKQIQGLRFIIAAIILLCISNTMIMSVLERTGEIGTAMALGAKRSSVLRQFLIEGALLGCIGGAIGLAVAVPLAHIISAIGIPMPPPPGKTHGFLGGILLTWTLCAQAFAVAVATTLLASVYPAWRASRMQIVDSLRHNR